MPLIVFSQFAGTSLWFAGNAVMPDLQAVLDLPDTALGNITSAVQIGFICGTLVFAFLMLADRFSPSLVFLISALLGAVSNVCILFFTPGFVELLAFRFLTGFFLAGIYPVGMKIAADWYESGLGKALGYLVGALVLGTAFPHLLKFLARDYPYQPVLIATSVLAALGGLSLYLGVGDGPYGRRSLKFDPGAVTRIFSLPDFRAAAFGYFGHMWELYAFWAYVPVLLMLHLQIGG
ncbi:MAG: MFS transporter, partial [Saprospiraceae bacterium]|nr:MFS transporter [Saprospiraceae bacterium]